MAFLITHFYEGGTADQYQAVIAAVWDSEASFDAFVHDTLLPALQDVDGGFAGPPQERTAEISNLLVA